MQTLTRPNSAVVWLSLVSAAVVMVWHSDGTIVPNMGKRSLPLLRESIDHLKPSDTVFWMIPTDAMREEKWGHEVEWIGNQHDIVEGVERERKRNAALKDIYSQTPYFW